MQVNQCRNYKRIIKAYEIISRKLRNEPEKQKGKGSFNTEEWLKLKTNLQSKCNNDLDYISQREGNTMVGDKDHGGSINDLEYEEISWGRKRKNIRLSLVISLRQAKRKQGNPHEESNSSEWTTSNLP